jgi:hypothetical protein
MALTVESATQGPDFLHLVIDRHRVNAGEKYTIIEMGYAVLLAANDESNSWLAEITETIPPNPDGSRGRLSGGDGSAVTSDPIVVALSYQDWWARNTDGFEPGREMPIPTREEATHIVRNRRILNEFNRKYEGKLPSEWQRGSRPVGRERQDMKSAIPFQLRFDRSQIEHWASRYSYEGEPMVMDEIAPYAKQHGHLTKDYLVKSLFQNFIS